MKNRSRLLWSSLLIGSLLALYTAHRIRENRYNKGRHYFGWSMTSIPDGNHVTPATGPNGTVYAASTDHDLYALQRP